MSIAALRLRRDGVMVVSDSRHLGGLTSKVVILPHLHAVLLTRGAALGGLYAAEAVLAGNHDLFASPLVDFASLADAFPIVFRAAVDHVVSCGGDGKLELTLAGYDAGAQRARVVTFDTLAECFEGADLPPGVWASPALADRDWPQPDGAALVELAQAQIAHMRGQGFVESTGGPLLETAVTVEGISTRMLGQSATFGAGLAVGRDL